ncbi:hypothetical protein O3M35_007989 [Rhynocoris fuscipes]|uniref:Uncharacterized protein n=1 Tax=Rhynocoris fuscipes TaxID=488301 RepID=A0AAW1DBA2_9HEMI
MYLISSILIINLLIIHAFAAASNITWPSTKLCNQNDRNINDCLLNAARESVPIIAKGMRKIGLKRLDPWKLYKHHFHVTKGPVTVGLTLDKGVVMGLGNTTFQAARLEKKTKSIILEGVHNKLYFKGLSNSTDNLKVTYTVKLRSNSTSVSMVMTGIDFSHVDIVDTTKGYLANLAFNKLINDNWELFYDTIKEEVERYLSREFTRTFRPVLSKFTFDDLMPKS